MTQRNTSEDDFSDKLVETCPVAITNVVKEGKFIYGSSKTEEVLDLEKSEIHNRIYNDSGWNITGFEGNVYPTEKLLFELVKKPVESIYGVQHAIEWPNDGRKLLSLLDLGKLVDPSGPFDL